MIRTYLVTSRELNCKIMAGAVCGRMKAPITTLLINGSGEEELPSIVGELLP